MTRLNRSAQRRVFRRKRRIPVGMVIRQLIVILLLLSGGIGIVALLQRLPEQVDLMVLVSQAISDLISGGSNSCSSPWSALGESFWLPHWWCWQES